jgi:hypothetical protein
VALKRLVPLLVLVSYAYLFPWLPALRSPNELTRLYQANAIVEEHALAIDGQLQRHGPVNDLSVKDGRHYPNKAPGMSFLGAAALAAVRPVGEAGRMYWLRLVLCMVPGAIAAELLRRILARRFDEGLAAAGAIVFALGTLMWPYSTFLMSHGPTTAALVACWWAIEKAALDYSPRTLDTAPREHPESSLPLEGGGPGRGSAYLWAFSGLMAGTAVFLEYTSAIALPPLALYAVAVRRPTARTILAALAGFLPPILALAAYHQAAFGNALHTGYAHLANPEFAKVHARGFMGVSAPSLTALVGSFVDPGRGLFAWSPFLALGIPGLWLMARKSSGRGWAYLCAGELLVYALFTASFDFEAWGWSVGPRHLTPLVAFLIPPAVATAEWLRARGAGFVAAGLALLGIALFGLTVAVCPYLPDELTNPVHELVLPLARMGHRSHDVLGLALGTSAWWTLLPWLGVVVALAWTTVRTLSSVRPERRAKRGVEGRRLASIAAACALALGLLAVHAQLGEDTDESDGTRAFMARQYPPPQP